ncbi:hypothetical protein NEOLI_002919 [Neolecta irregularis DAH-3]|uniref:Uncharacterized protein n=1 Tax=Neolecta irregularis (strain DAH-3) TaxID=1198029 RepID=A0A1U7LNH1_NEOID|nr:hypothetical protein NEOLI_002919 [Neolecta irregularis DAH-3]|eukprot:OLL24092.1 hypothetical protein NEOLI_002919 [Neolecta irregularis DAH-3]
MPTAYFGSPSVLSIPKTLLLPLQHAVCAFRFAYPSCSGPHTARARLSRSGIEHLAAAAHHAAGVAIVPQWAGVAVYCLAYGATAI